MRNRSRTPRSNGVASAASASERLFDFNTSDGGWKSNQEKNTLTLSDEYPIEGERSLLFSGPARKGWADISPTFEVHFHPAKDLSRFDHLAVPVYNDSSSELEFNFIISDSTRPFQQGARFGHVLQPYCEFLFVLPVKHAFKAGNINPADISIIHCWTGNPADVLRIFIGNFTMLLPGEPPPKLPDDYLEKIRRKQEAFLAPRLKQLETEVAAFDVSSLSRENARYVRERAGSMLARFRSGEANESLLTAKSGTPLEWSSLQSLVPVLSGFTALRDAVTAAPDCEDVLLGYATSMEKVLPRVPVFHPLPEVVSLECAQNEQEAAQLIVMPLGKERKKVGVKLTAFTGEAGTLPASSLSAVPVGFVETTFATSNCANYVGCWPDPLLAFLDTVDVKAGEAQPFWIKADIPAGQPAGIYTGKAEIVIDGNTAFSVPVSIRVHDFVLPDCSMLPLAVTFHPSAGTMAACNMNFDPEAGKSPAAPVHAWKRHKREWRSLLAGYYLMLDSLYEHPDWEPELELLAELAPEKKLGLFNLGYFHSAANDPADNYGMQSTIDRIRPRYEKAKQLGILKNAYIYGADENTPERFPLINRAAGILRKEFPEVPIFTTAFDESYGTDGRMGTVNWFCPLTAKFNAEQAAVARKTGKQVWWYICCSPREPYANNFIESAGIEIRLLMGAMSAKYRPDGFLYYQTSLWTGTEPITGGPYTGWCAHSFPGCNGDGNWTYPGPDGTPLGSIRLENFRDGLEDYAYAMLLEQRLAAAKQTGQNPQWQREAEETLKVPASLVESLTEYTRDPQQLYAWRSRLAELIERAPVKE